MSLDGGIASCHPVQQYPLGGRGEDSAGNVRSFENSKADLNIFMALKPMRSFARTFNAFNLFVQCKRFSRLSMPCGDLKLGFYFQFSEQTNFGNNFQKVYNSV